MTAQHHWAIVGLCGDNEGSEAVAVAHREKSPVDPRHCIQSHDIGRLRSPMYRTFSGIVGDVRPSSFFQQRSEQRVEPEPCSIVESRVAV